MKKLGTLDEKAMKAGNVKTCVRKEFRQLTEEERDKFTNCLHTLRLSGKYKMVADIHDKEAMSKAHRSVNFLSWHSVYMRRFEKALQEGCNDNSICAPYWDPRLDANLNYPKLSVFFHLFGGIGRSLKGALRSWSLSGRFSATKIEREVGADGENIEFNYNKYDEIFEGVTSTSDMVHVSGGSGNADTIVEIPHNRLHVYISGTVSDIVEAAADPIFFMIHGFIEFTFDSLLKKLPSAKRTYPKHAPADRGPNDTMVNLDVNNSYGYLDSFRKLFTHADPPSCPCNTPDDQLYCCEYSTAVPRPHCVSKIRVGKYYVPDTTYCPDASAMRTKPNPKIRAPKHPPILNNFLLNGVINHRDWVYVAVRVTGRYRRHGISSNSPYKSFYDLMKGKAKTFDGCTNVEKAYTHATATGSNYEGRYEDFVYLNHQRDTKVIYLGIKKPSLRSPSDVFLNAHDECGKLCRPYCPIKNSRKYGRCDGLIRVDARPPYLYFGTIGEVKRMYAKHLRMPYAVHFVCDGTVALIKRKSWFIS